MSGTTPLLIGIEIIRINKRIDYNPVISPKMFAYNCGIFESASKIKLFPDHRRNPWKE